jgi:hypothetical protein
MAFSDGWVGLSEATGISPFSESRKTGSGGEDYKKECRKADWAKMCGGTTDYWKISRREVLREAGILTFRELYSSSKSRAIHYRNSER